MPYYQVEFYTEAEALHQDVVEAPSEVLVPFRLREKGHTDLKRVKTCTMLTPMDFNKYVVEVTPLVVSSVAAVDDPPPIPMKDPYKPDPGCIFIKYGTPGLRYLIGCQVYDLIRISEWSIRVKLPSGKMDYIAPFANAVLFDPVEHAKYLPKKMEPED
jgi:hypothetical protein